MSELKIDNRWKTSLSLTAMISDHSDDEEPTTNTEPTTRVAGFWIDPVTQFTGGYKKSDPISLSGTVRLMADRVLKKVNTEYSFVPKLKRSDMIFEPLCGNTLPALAALLSFLLNMFYQMPKMLMIFMELKTSKKKKALWYSSHPKNQ
jgi:hypothetical protein